MQTQQTRSATQSITHTQSLAAVRTLLQAGLGAIAYLRFFYFLRFSYMHKPTFCLKKFTTRGQFFFMSVFRCQISQSTADHELGHFNTTSDDFLLASNSDTSFSSEASQTGNSSRKNTNHFRIMVSFIIVASRSD